MKSLSLSESMPDKSRISPKLNSLLKRNKLKNKFDEVKIEMLGNELSKKRTNITEELHEDILDISACRN